MSPVEVPPGERDCIAVREFVALFLEEGHPNGDAIIERIRSGDPSARVQSSDDRRLWLRTTPRDSVRPSEAVAETRFVLGDPLERTGVEGESPGGNSVLVEWNPRGQDLVVESSILGLPAVYVHRGDSAVVVSSSVESIRQIVGTPLTFDPDSALEAGALGFVTGQKTLFRDVERLEGGTRMALTAGGPTALERLWSWSPDRETIPDKRASEELSARFLDAVGRLAGGRHVLSLTGGLDTRAVLSALVSRDIRVPCATLTGPIRTIDAEMAGDLCRHYGLPHYEVPLAGTFLDELPRLCETACRLSGGLTSIQQAHEVYYHETLAELAGSRISGNGGNQIGRGGTELTGLRGIGPEIWSHDFRSRATSEDGAEWPNCIADTRTMSKFQFLLGHELQITSLANYSIGSHYMIQRSPYTDRHLLDVASRAEHMSGSFRAGSGFEAKIRDLRHRFGGRPDSISFQHDLIRRCGGYASRYPLNWGLAADRSISPRGILRGVGGLMDTVARSYGLYRGPLGGIVDRSPFAGRAEFRDVVTWEFHTMRSFVQDVLRSESVRQSGIFDVREIDRLLDSHALGDVSVAGPVEYALDMSLAYRTFCTDAGH